MLKIIPISKAEAAATIGSLTETSKMPCRSFDLPVAACQAGFKLAQLPGTICHDCYAAKNNYLRFANNIEPAQHVRLSEITNPYWVESMTTLIGADEYFRWFSSGDLQSLAMVKNIVAVAQLTPWCKHWLATREYSIIIEYVKAGGVIPDNLMVRLSATYPDKPVTLPASLRGVANITTSNAHTVTPLGLECQSYKHGNTCADCRACWSSDVVSYRMH
jgi:hypothetical protein